MNLVTKIIIAGFIFNFIFDLAENNENVKSVLDKSTEVVLLHQPKDEVRDEIIENIYNGLTHEDLNDTYVEYKQGWEISKNDNVEIEITLNDKSWPRFETNPIAP